MDGIENVHRTPPTEELEAKTYDKDKVPQLQAIPTASSSSSSFHRDRSQTHPVGSDKVFEQAVSSARSSSPSSARKSRGTPRKGKSKAATVSSAPFGSIKSVSLGKAGSSKPISTATAAAAASSLAAKAAIVSATVASTAPRRTAADERLEKAVLAANARAARAVETAEKTLKDSLVTRLKAALVETSARALELFKEWDEDGNGVIDIDEFSRALTALRLGGTREEHDALFHRWDTDGSGGLDFEELQAALTGHVPSRPASQAASASRSTGWVRVRSSYAPDTAPISPDKQAKAKRKTVALDLNSKQLMDLAVAQDAKAEAKEKEQRGMVNLTTRLAAALAQQMDESMSSKEAAKQFMYKVIDHLTSSSPTLTLTLRRSFSLWCVCVRWTRTTTRSGAPALTFPPLLCSRARISCLHSSQLLSKMEFRQALRELGLMGSEFGAKEVDELFVQLDKDNSGELDLNEVAGVSPLTNVYI